MISRLTVFLAIMLGVAAAVAPLNDTIHIKVIQPLPGAHITLSRVLVGVDLTLGNNDSRTLMALRGDADVCCVLRNAYTHLIGIDWRAQT